MAVGDFYENEVMSAFVYYAVICIFKTLAVGGLTSFVRVVKGVFINPEDAKAFITSSDPAKKKLIPNDTAVDRVKRIHLNDLENIPAFIFLGYFYVMTSPDPVTALWHFRVFGFARILHTISYQLGLQPWRALCHFAGLAVMISMGVTVLKTV